MTMITRSRLAALTPDEAAALWLVQQDGGMPVEAGLFEDWLAQDEENRAAWGAAHRAWSLFDDADDPAFATLREAALADTGPEPSWFQGRWRPAAAAAALIAVVAGGAQLVRTTTDGGEQLATAPRAESIEQTYVAPVGEAQEIALADGSRMTLERNAQARVTVSATRRDVALDRGGALFAVRHDAARPFTVTARDRTVVDLGTRFAVTLEKGATRVVLYEGSVRVDGGAGGAILLHPGQQLVARAGGRDDVSSLAAGVRTPGADEFVQFDDVPLAAAIESVNRTSRVKLAATDPRVARLRLSGRFRVGDPERFARTVADLLSLRVVRVSKGRIELRRR